MKLGMQVGLDPGHIVLDGDLAPMSIVAKRLYQVTTWSQPRRHCVRWEPSSASPKWAQPPTLVNVRCGQTAEWTKMPLGMEVSLGPGDFVLHGDPAPL